VTLGLALRVDVVVAGGAAARADGHVAEDHTGKGVQAVAAVAALRDRDVLDRHGQGAARVVPGMAGGTVARGALEDAALVAVFATDVFVLAEQGVAGGGVIEAGAAARLGLCRTPEARETQQQDEHQKPRQSDAAETTEFDKLLQLQGEPS
jgi:hypothetical protein